MKDFVLSKGREMLTAGHDLLMVSTQMKEGLNLKTRTKKKKDMCEEVPDEHGAHIQYKPHLTHTPGYIWTWEERASYLSSRRAEADFNLPPEKE